MVLAIILWTTKCYDRILHILILNIRKVLVCWSQSNKAYLIGERVFDWQISVDADEEDGVNGHTAEYIVKDIPHIAPELGERPVTYGTAKQRQLKLT